MVCEHPGEVIFDETVSMILMETDRWSWKAKIKTAYSRFLWKWTDDYLIFIHRGFLVSPLSMGLVELEGKASRRFLTIMWLISSSLWIKQISLILKSFPIFVSFLAGLANSRLVLGWFLAGSLLIIWIS